MYTVLFQLYILVFKLLPLDIKVALRELVVGKHCVATAICIVKWNKYDHAQALGRRWLGKWKVENIKIPMQIVLLSVDFVIKCYSNEV